jgi:hypothetical protein
MEDLPQSNPLIYYTNNFIDVVDSPGPDISPQTFLKQRGNKRKLATGICMRQYYSVSGSERRLLCSPAAMRLSIVFQLFRAQAGGEWCFLMYDDRNAIVSGSDG